MIKGGHLILIVGIIFLVNCKADQDPSNYLNQFEGHWQVEAATLDGTLMEDWEQTQLEITTKANESLRIHCSGQPANRKLIWPDKSSLKLISQASLFLRNDSLEITFTITEKKLFIFMHPPRSLSYEEECPDDEYYLICTEGGNWVFELKHKKS